jgi:hypothetical protein
MLEKGSPGHRLCRDWARLAAQGLFHWFASIFILNRWFLAWIQRKGRILVRYDPNRVWVESGHDTAWAQSLRLTQLEHGVQAWHRDSEWQPVGGRRPVQDDGDDMDKLGRKWADRATGVGLVMRKILRKRKRIETGRLDLAQKRLPDF